jgi:hypothetical protein
VVRRSSAVYDLGLLVVAILLARVVPATAFKDYLERDRGGHCMICPPIRDPPREFLDPRPIEL